LAPALAGRALPINSKFNYIVDFTSAPQFFNDSNPILTNRRLTNFMASQPSIESTSVNEASLPSFKPSSPISINKGKDRMFDTFEDIPLGPQDVNLPRIGNIIDPDATPKAGNINLPNDYWNPFD